MVFGFVFLVVFLAGVQHLCTSSTSTLPREDLQVGGKANNGLLTHGRWSGFFVKELKRIWRGGFPDQASTAVTCFGCCCMQARGEAVWAEESWELGCRSTSATHTSDVHPSWAPFGWAGDWFGGTATWGLSAASPWCRHQWIGTLLLMNLSSWEKVSVRRKKCSHSAKNVFSESRIFPFVTKKQSRGLCWLQASSPDTCDILSNGRGKVSLYRGFMEVLDAVFTK